MFAAQEYLKGENFRVWKPGPLLHAMDQQALEAVLLEQIERLEQTTESRHQSVGGTWE